MFQAMHAKMTSPKTLTFKVTRKAPELISPAEPTPYDLKPLSNIDDQGGLRFHVPMIYFYPKNPSMEGKDPVHVIRDVVAKALVYYYPLAGRLRELAGRKLVVECSGQRVVFVEADADVTLQQFGDDDLYPPFPYLEELLLDMHGSHGILHSPLILIQVTRLKCGGFIFAYRFNHTMCDGAGIFQFMSAVGEVVRGATPSILPVWERHLLTARHTPRVSFEHREYDVITGETPIPVDTMVHRSFFFTATEISTLRRRLPPHLQNCSTFELVAACVWRCRTLAISRKADEETRFICVVDIRKRMNPPLPPGYYGNALAFPAAVTTAEKLSKNPLPYAVELVRKAKYKAKDAYVRSVADLMVERGRPSFTEAMMSYMVSDLKYTRLEQLELGWGKAAYGGVAKSITDWLPLLISWYIPFTNRMGEDGLVVPVLLPLNAMEDFTKLLQSIITPFNIASPL